MQFTDDTELVTAITVMKVATCELREAAIYYQLKGGVTALNAITLDSVSQYVFVGYKNTDYQDEVVVMTYCNFLSICSKVMFTYTNQGTEEAIAQGIAFHNGNFIIAS